MATHAHPSKTVIINPREEDSSRGLRGEKKKKNSNWFHRTFSKKMNVLCFEQWKGRREFVLAQLQVMVVVAIARFFNTWEPSYPRNDNYNPAMFGLMMVFLCIAAAVTLKHETNANHRIFLLSRQQTEEWKGWMQWAFIMVRNICMNSRKNAKAFLCFFFIFFCCH
jgi:hypothetical protein